MIAGLALLRNPEQLLGKGEHCLPQSARKPTELSTLLCSLCSYYRPTDAHGFLSFLIWTMVSTSELVGNLPRIACHLEIGACVGV